MEKKQRMRLKALLYTLLFVGSLALNLDFSQKAIPVIAVIDLWMECA